MIDEITVNKAISKIVKTVTKDNIIMPWSDEADETQKNFGIKIAKTANKAICVWFIPTTKDDPGYDVAGIYISRDALYLTTNWDMISKDLLEDGVLGADGIKTLIKYSKTLDYVRDSNDLKKVLMGLNSLISNNLDVVVNELPADKIVPFDSYDFGVDEKLLNGLSKYIKFERI